MSSNTVKQKNHFREMLQLQSSSPSNSRDAFLSVTTWPSATVSGRVICPPDTKWVLTDTLQVLVPAITSALLPCTSFSQVHFITFAWIICSFTLFWMMSEAKKGGKKFPSHCIHTGQLFLNTLYCPSFSYSIPKIWKKQFTSQATVCTDNAFSVLLFIKSPFHWKYMPSTA
jgi:hypothetical protein